jgi:hypothetical protein
MKWLGRLGWTLVLTLAVWAAFRALTDPRSARALALVSLPLSLWTARLITAWRHGIITRRMPMLDGGPTRAGHFWSFRPDVYERRPGFDHFKGYFVKEAALLLLLWAMLLSVGASEVASRL